MQQFEEGDIVRWLHQDVEHVGDIVTVVRDGVRGIIQDRRIRELDPSFRGGAIVDNSNNQNYSTTRGRRLRVQVRDILGVPQAVLDRFVQTYGADARIEYMVGGVANGYMVQELLENDWGGFEYGTPQYLDTSRVIVERVTQDSQTQRRRQRSPQKKSLSPPPQRRTPSSPTLYISPSPSPSYASPAKKRTKQREPSGQEEEEPGEAQPTVIVISPDDGQVFSSGSGSRGRASRSPVYQETKRPSAFQRGLGGLSLFKNREGMRSPPRQKEVVPQDGKEEEEPSGEELSDEEKEEEEELPPETASQQAIRITKQEAMIAEDLPLRAKNVYNLLLRTIAVAVYDPQEDRETLQEEFQDMWDDYELSDQQWARDYHGDAPNMTKVFENANRIWDRMDNGESLTRSVFRFLKKIRTAEQAMRDNSRREPRLNLDFTEMYPWVLDIIGGYTESWVERPPADSTPEQAAKHYRDAIARYEAVEADKRKQIVTKGDGPAAFTRRHQQVITDFELLRYGGEQTTQTRRTVGYRKQLFEYLKVQIERFRELVSRYEGEAGGVDYRAKLAETEEELNKLFEERRAVNFVYDIAQDHILKERLMVPDPYSDEEKDLLQDPSYLRAVKRLPREAWNQGARAERLKTGPYRYAGETGAKQEQLDYLEDMLLAIDRAMEEERKKYDKLVSDMNKAEGGVDDMEELSQIWDKELVDEEGGEGAYRTPTEAEKEAHREKIRKWRQELAEEDARNEEEEEEEGSMSLGGSEDFRGSGSMPMDIDCSVCKQKTSRDAHYGLACSECPKTRFCSSMCGLRHMETTH